VPDNIVVFEDDICFDRYNTHTLASAIDFLSTQTNWKMLFLGCMVRGSRKTKKQKCAEGRFPQSVSRIRDKRGFRGKTAGKILAENTV
jgi:GR25 family glycosyltransferase involved in LPS biosynthesis